MIPFNFKNNEFILNRNVYDTIRKECVLHKNSEYKNEINITENTEKKDFIQNLEVIKKKSFDVISTYNNKSTKISSENSNATISILLKLYNHTNSLIDEIELTNEKLISKYNHLIKNFDKSKKISFGKNKSNEYIINDNSISPIQFYIKYNENKKKIFNNG